MVSSADRVQAFVAQIAPLMQDCEGRVLVVNDKPLILADLLALLAEREAHESHLAELRATVVARNEYIDKQASDILGIWNENAEAEAQVQTLQAEHAALWAVVRAADTLRDRMKDANLNPECALAFDTARAALAKLEKEQGEHD